MVYSVLETKAASKQLNTLPAPIVLRVLAALADLATNPRPQGCRKTRTVLGDVAWRVRVGDYRIVYDIDDRAQEVRVFAIRHRRDVYRAR
jgi:mRNA interferase RelE/StbE